MLPMQARAARGMCKQSRVRVCIAHNPLLGFIAEADVRGADDMEASKCMEIDRLGVEAVYAPASVEADGAIHELSPNCCRFC